MEKRAGPEADSSAQWFKAWLHAMDVVFLSQGICLRAVDWTMRPSQTPGMVGTWSLMRRSLYRLGVLVGQR